MSAIISREELSASFLEVRKAYRLLYFYQRRVLDTVKYIADTLGIKVESGWALYSNNAPKDGKHLSLDLWAWDWLNMYMYEFYCGERKIGNDTYKFAIQVQADTGPYDAWVDATSVHEFGDAEQADTRLLFVIGKNRWKNEDYNKNTGYADFFDISALKAKGNPEFIEVSNDQSEVFLLKSYPLDGFIDEEHIQDKLKDFRAFIRLNGLADIFG